MVQEKEKQTNANSILGNRNLFGMKILNPLLERATGMKKVKSLYSSELHDCSENEFIERAIDILKLDFKLNLDELKNIPVEGPVIVVANHPFGIQDALLINAILKEVREDYKVMANSFFAAVEPLKDRMILVDAFEDHNKANLKPLKKSIHLLKNGGVLGVFPAGSVSHIEFGKTHYTDSEWSDTIAGLVEITGATVVPVHFSGRNSLTFNIAGLLHEKIRTAMLPREIFKKKKTIEINIGKAIQGKYLKSLSSRREMVDYLKMRCYLLENKDTMYKNAVVSKNRELKKVVDALPKAEISKEISVLPESCKLIEYKDFSVYCCKSQFIPNTLHEIGRLREITFREVEEGTGDSIDLDEYDETYLHLFIWNRELEEIVGAYRMGQVDALLDKGLENLYTANFYKYNRKFLEEHKNALEMGRSFIRKEYQRKPYSLLLLWRGICTYIARNPQYKYLFGAVSMSDDYDPRSRALTAVLLIDRQNQLKSKAPVNIKINSEVRDFCEKYHFDKFTDLSELVKGIEQDGKDIPVLIKQYMKLGGKFHSFCVDEEFGNTLDGLIVVDLTEAPLKSLKQYMGDDAESYLEFHRRVR